MCTYREFFPPDALHLFVYMREIVPAKNAKPVKDSAHALYRPRNIRLTFQRTKEALLGLLFRLWPLQQSARG